MSSGQTDCGRRSEERAFRTEPNSGREFTDSTVFKFLGRQRKHLNTETCHDLPVFCAQLRPR